MKNGTKRVRNVAEKPRRKQQENNQIVEQYNYSGNYQVETLFSLITYDKDSYSEMSSSSLKEILQAVQSDKKSWIIIKGLTNIDAVSEIGLYANLNRLEIQDVLNANHPVKIDANDEHLLVILNECYEGEENHLHPEHLTICMRSGLLITFQETDNVFFKNVKEAVRDNKTQLRERGVDYLLCVILNNIVGNYIQRLRFLEDRLGEMEDILFERSEKDDFRLLIQKYRREHVLIRQNIGPLNEEYNVLLRLEGTLIDVRSAAVYNDMKDHLKYALQLLDSCRETLSSLGDMYLSNNDLRMNSIMQRLTVVATIFIPLTFLAGVWGMNFQQMPELSWKYGYLIAWGIMIFTGLLLWLFFVKRKWF